MLFVKKILIFSCFLITVFSLFSISNSRQYKKEKSCNTKNSEVAEIITIKKDRNGQVISKEIISYPQRKLILNIDDWKQKLGSIKKIKHMSSTQIKQNLEKLIKSKIKNTKKNKKKNKKTKKKKKK